MASRGRYNGVDSGENSLRDAATERRDRLSNGSSLQFTVHEDRTKNSPGNSLT